MKQKLELLQTRQSYEPYWADQCSFPYGHDLIALACLSEIQVDHNGCISLYFCTRPKHYGHDHVAHMDDFVDGVFLWEVLYSW